MKTMRKLFAGMLAIVMMLAMSVPVNAAEIQVQNVLNGETYSAYKILNYTNSGDAYSYYLTKEQYDQIGIALKTAGFKFTASADGTQYFVNNAASIDAADAASKLASANLKNAIATYTATGTKGQANFEGLETGYYFVTSSLGSLCALHSEKELATVVEKNTMLTDAESANKTSLQIGDSVQYTITLTDGKGTNVQATLTDTLSKGLTFDANSVVVRANGKNLAKDTDYTVQVTGGNGAETTVVYTFTANVMAQLEENQAIVVTYNAKLNQYASLEGKETNTESTAYSKQKTQGNTVDVHDYNLTIYKTDGKDALKGAKFALYRNDETTALHLASINVDSPGTDTVYYRVAEKGETNSTATIDMTNASSAVIYGLDGNSTYKARETQAPDGYNLLAEDASVTMNNQNQTMTIENKAGSELPSTGGMGTTMFYVLGAVLVLGAGVVMVVRKRMNDR